ncbi:MAG: addiction module antitoxin RelB [Nitrospinae bacterium RIFCSPLOWO2_02_39_17]|nr:MAG: addiction module antitoxin RelB [Nitrospinae bacterium RIFCSPHIGHO2_02_39_11]OGV98774.1 MAG: addiction module antitoxin RelB [Nitrospinae bacterium RIFCSPHIGHO2_12_FULL_39_42]OGW00588.1 MAG: addiction module antitoxin RelB [Nitrospinae bacterium RIFCSPHIGHO2_02_FULL_39_82]OGW06495.1 MAG: addiction module antitoxin RelB [Nitrospinae bacterium RIFCSPLOWO2_02_39_17]OGW09148.1 MAG: addiction module antitoxin RelB [Nitrospinae bacterium RIFCSPLOWO2_12_39_15]OGW09326.1 MAG: addiction module 
MSFEELKAEALKMSPKSRAELAKELLVSLETLSDAEIEQLWIDEAIRRDDEIDRGVAQIRPADEVFNRARNRFK